MRGGIPAGIFLGASMALAAGGAFGASKTKLQVTVEILKHTMESRPESVQQVTFPETGWSTVKIVRGGSPGRDNGQKPDAKRAEVPEVVTFTGPDRSAVKIFRGDSERRATVSEVRSTVMTTQVVTFASLPGWQVNILRGATFDSPLETGLYAPASGADLDRVAFAVDGAESSHGADMRMWRPEPRGPQGPMQITAAAAFDVGGGDRFDLSENRALGRAYLARMYRRYGNWPDAVAAYNWGPGNVDAWIIGGRASNKLPLEVERYRNRVLRDATLIGPRI